MYNINCNLSSMMLTLSPVSAQLEQSQQYTQTGFNLKCCFLVHPRVMHITVSWFFHIHTDLKCSGAVNFDPVIFWVSSHVRHKAACNLSTLCTNWFFLLVWCNKQLWIVLCIYMYWWPASYNFRLFTMLRLMIFEPWHEISNNVVCATSKGSDQPAHTCSLVRAFASRLSIIWL